tara:strand:+ start:82 stop:276 length:195 start_codon:yes stop_codon:yes gene_type:complete
MNNRAKKVIPPEVFRNFGDVFRDKKIRHDYSDELAELFYLLAEDAEFHLALEKTWGDWYSEKLH